MDSYTKVDHVNQDKYNIKLIDNRDDTHSEQISINKNELGYDAWNRNKVVNDFSLFHGVWTVDVPDNMWIEHYDGAEIPKTNATSLDGMLNVDSAGGENYLSSKRHPRYQPNRGLLYSSSVLLPNKDALALREFGAFNGQFGVFFRLKNGVLYACRRTTSTALVTTTTEEEISTDLIPSLIDLENGNIFDIQMQWRGVGNIKFFIGDPLTGQSIKVHTMNLLGTLKGLSIGNPALPIGFLSKNLGDDAAIQAGCVDSTSEGGFKENRQRGIVSSGEITLTTSEVPILLLNVPEETANGWINTRDIAMRRTRAYSNENTLIRVYYTRDSALFVGTTYTSTDTQGTTRYSTNGDIAYAGGAKLINEDRIPAFGSVSLDNPDEAYGDFYLTHGDYFLVTLQAKNNSLGGASMEWGAEV